MKISKINENTAFYDSLIIKQIIDTAKRIHDSTKHNAAQTVFVLDSYGSLDYKNTKKEN